MKTNTKYSNPLDKGPGVGSPLNPAIASGSVKRVNHAASSSSLSKDSEFTAPIEGNVLPPKRRKASSR